MRPSQDPNPSDDAPKWQAMDAPERAEAYSPSSAIGGNYAPFIDRYTDLSRAAYTALPKVRTIRYGPRPANTIDLIVPETPAPCALHVFIHGGYWQAVSKTQSFFPAPGALDLGAAFAAMDYTLAPDARIENIVVECADALTQLFVDADTLGIDPGRVVISGSSAGAHLAVMAALALPVEMRPRGLLLLSGIFDLSPLVGTYINDPLGMTSGEARRLSPMRLNLSRLPETTLAWGAQETDEFKRQSRAFSRRLRGAGIASTTLEIPGRNHFDLAEDLAEKSDLWRELERLLGQATGMS